MNAITLIARVSFTNDNEDFEAVLYTDGYIDMHVWGCTPDGVDYDYSYPSSLENEMTGGFEPGSKERAFAYAVSEALYALPVGRVWWYSRSARDDLGLQPEAGDQMAQMVIDWAL